MATKKGVAIQVTLTTTKAWRDALKEHRDQIDQIIKDSMGKLLRPKRRKKKGNKKGGR